MDNVKKALILAAGLGTRLMPMTDAQPKALVSVNGKPILLKQIENLIDNGIADITVVAGYKAEILASKVHAVYPHIHIVESVDYAITNNMYSAYLGMKDMFPDGVMEPFMMMNADVFYDASVVKALLANEHENAVVVDTGRYIEESMKVVERDQRLVAISKKIAPEDAMGSSIDVYKLGIDGAKAFFERCVQYIEVKKERKLWSEVALDDAFSSAEFFACPLVGRWLEIDTHEDLAVAEELFSEPLKAPSSPC